MLAWEAGGDCLEDFECLRGDRGVAAMLGHEVPSPEAARKFLYQFHDPKKVTLPGFHGYLTSHRQMCNYSY